MNVTRSLLVFLFASTLISAPATAQTTWIESTSDAPQVSLEWTKPSLEEGGTSFLTSRLLLTGQYPVSEATRLVADVPISRFGTEDGNVSSTTLGNPYLGTRYHFDRRGAAGVGVRLPLAKVNAAESLEGTFAQPLSLAIGSYADLHRTEAFAPETMTARGYFERTFHPGSNISFRFRPGISVLIPTEDDSRNPNSLVDYTAQTWYGDSQFRTGLGLGGRTDIWGNGSLRERSVFFLDGAVQAQLGKVRPGIVIRTPLSEDISSTINYAVGVTLTVAL